MGRRIKNRRHELFCDGCGQLLGQWSVAFGDVEMNPRAGYVLGVAKRREGIACGRGEGCQPLYEHPLACSDYCEDRLLATWPRTTADMVRAEDWGEDFRDSDLT